MHIYIKKNTLSIVLVELAAIHHYQSKFMKRNHMCLLYNFKCFHIFSHCNQEATIPYNYKSVYSKNCRIHKTFYLTVSYTFSNKNVIFRTIIHYLN